jgi:integral membrane protein (TIGR01906 family)
MLSEKNLRIISLVATALFIVCIPLFLLASNVRWVANDLSYYQDGFEKYDVSRDTGFSDEELTDISIGLINYFNSGAPGDTMDIFSDEEIIHLNDVMGLIQLDYMIQWITLTYIFVYVAAVFTYKQRRFLPLLNIGVAAGAAVGIVGVALIGLAAFVDFDRLFIAFHHVFFTNDFWISSGYLPRIYTSGFFLDAARTIGIMAVLQSLLIGVPAGFLLLRQRRRRISSY